MANDRGATDEYTVSESHIVGIGAVLNTAGNYIQVVEIIPGGPAAVKGTLKPLDKIVGVGQSENGIEDVVGWPLERVVGLIKGKKGSTVTLKVIAGEGDREGDLKLITLTRNYVEFEKISAENKILKIASIAESGDADAQLALGVMFLYGDGVLQNDETAIEWIMKSAKQGNSEAQVLIGDAYRLGRGVKNNFDTAAKWYAEAAEKGYRDAQYQLGIFYQFGVSFTKNQQIAARWFTKAAEQGHPSAQYCLGFLYAFGEGVGQNSETAVKWYTKAAEQGYANAQYSLGLAYFHGDGIPQNHQTSVFWFTTAAEQGHDRAQYNLGVVYSHGKGVAKNAETAAKWYRKAGEQGHHDAQYFLGQAYYYGDGVAQNSEIAVRWYTKAAEQGSAIAQYNLGVAFSDGNGAAKNSDAAVYWYKKAAEQGYASAQHNLGVAFSNGNGVAKDYDAAVHWYTKAAEQEHRSAQTALGYAYDLGEGVEKNSETAAYWYKKAASKGDLIAQSNLSGLNKYPATSLEYQKLSFDSGELSVGYGIALKHLDKTSGFYYPKAAFDVLRITVDKGVSDTTYFSTALTLLGYMYAEGVHVSKDRAKALALFTKADPVNIDPSVFELVLPTLITTFTPELLKKYTPPLMAYMDEFCTNDYFQFGGFGFTENPIWAILDSVKHLNENLVDRCFRQHIGAENDNKNYRKISERYQEGVRGFIPRNEEKAFKYMLLAAESDNLSSGNMHLAARFFETGYGTAISNIDALSWYEKAAKLGSAYSLNRLGQAYEIGELGLAINPETAYDYYKRAYAQDESCNLCMTDLGRMYAVGEVVDQDYSMAKIYYTKAFKLGDIQAGNLLASLKLEGLGGARNRTGAIASFQRVLLGNAKYKQLVGKKAYDSEIDKAHEQLVALGVLKGSRGVINLGKYHALVIGNSNYKYLDKLANARKDASDIAKVLERDYGFSVELLVDASRLEMLTSLNRFRRELKKNDNFLLYYAGHGYIDETKQGYWQSVDSPKGDDDIEWISNEQIHRTLRKFKANNILVVADSCFSGSINRGMSYVDEDVLDKSSSQKTGDVVLERLHVAKSRISITSGGLEKVPDRIGFSENSVFADSFIKALEGNSQLIKSRDIFEAVRKRVVPITEAENINQTPEFGHLNKSGHEGGDFIFDRVVR
jgi:TPR repeat protein